MASREVECPKDGTFCSSFVSTIACTMALNTTIISSPSTSTFSFPLFDQPISPNEFPLLQLQRRQCHCMQDDSFVTKFAYLSSRARVACPDQNQALRIRRWQQQTSPPSESGRCCRSHQLNSALPSSHEHRTRTFSIYRYSFSLSTYSSVVAL